MPGVRDGLPVGSEIRADCGTGTGPDRAKLQAAVSHAAPTQLVLQEDHRQLPLVGIHGAACALLPTLGIADSIAQDRASPALRRSRSRSPVAGDRQGILLW